MRTSVETSTETGAAAAGFGTTLVISPHLDDAVFGCGELLSRVPGAHAVTVFAGLPPVSTALTDWDRASGFASAADSVRQRRDEDRRALEKLSAKPRWLDFLDAQYGDTPAPAAIAEALLALIAELRPRTVLLPLGLFHSDHALTHEAALAVRRKQPATVAAWLGYEDALYRRRAGLLQARLAKLLAHGIRATPLAVPGDSAAKAGAVRCYESQITALGASACADLSAPEGFWRLEEIEE